jgi:hypothetical protein
MSLIGALMDWILSGVNVSEARTPEIVGASRCRRTDQYLPL